jgi:hypothetical protein
MPWNSFRVILVSVSPVATPAFLSPYYPTASIQIQPIHRHAVMKGMTITGTPQIPDDRLQYVTAHCILEGISVVRGLMCHFISLRSGWSS